MKFKIFIFAFVFVFLINSVSAVTNVNFNYEFNNSKSIAFSNIVKDDSIVLNLHTDVNSLFCKYSLTKGASYGSMEGTFDFSFLDLHKKSFSYLQEGIYKYYVLCKDENNTIGKESELIFSIINPVKAQVIMSKDSPVNSGLLEVTLKTTKQLSQKPSLSYSFNGDKYENIPLEGSNDLWTGFILIPSNIGEVIGSFKFRGIDLDGIIGEEITDGELFLVDTKYPETINDISAEGKDNNIYIEWRFNEDYSYFNIYRSKFSNVEYTDFYKKIDKKEFKDNDVDLGRIYYYRITAVDKAGNEGELSYEFSAIAIKEGESTVENTGLDYELVGLVDSFIFDLDDFYQDVKEIRNEMASDNEKEIEIKTFNLLSDIDSSLKEIESIKNEVEGYKQQKLTKTDLEKKISNAKTRLNVIKKKSPESIVVVSKTKFNSLIDGNKIREVMINLGNAEPDSILKRSLEFMDENGFSYETDVRNVEIYYMDGSKSEKGFVIKKIQGSLYNGTIIEYISKDLAKSTSEISFKDSRYNVLKEDPIVEFQNDVEEIIYSVDHFIDINSAKESLTFFLIRENDAGRNGITGFSILDGGVNKKLILPVLIIFIVGAILFFLYGSNKSKKDLETIEKIGDKLIESKVYLEKREIEKLKKIYTEVNALYKSLSDKNKEEVYNKLNEFSIQIKSLNEKNAI